MAPVTVQSDDGANAAVAGPLMPGETVVTEGQLRVEPNGAVKVIGGRAAPSHTS